MVWMTRLAAALGCFLRRSPRPSVQRARKPKVTAAHTTSSCLQPRGRHATHRVSPGLASSPALPASRPVSVSTAAVIVHYHGAAIDACVRSLLNGTTMPARIVVIDNGSDPNWEAVFVREFPGVVIVRSPRNLGFAGALSATVADYAL